MDTKEKKPKQVQLRLASMLFPLTLKVIGEKVLPNIEDPTLVPYNLSPWYDAQNKTIVKAHSRNLEAESLIENNYKTRSRCALFFVKRTKKRLIEHKTKGFQNFLD